MVDVKHTLCCGCGLCAEVCPVHSIKMVANEEGFLYPQIDEKKCVNCGVCEKACIFSIPIEGKEPINCYLTAHRDETVQYASSSGGAYTAICQAIAECHPGQKVTYYGASWQKNFTVKHERVTVLDDISRFRKSKYIQSEMNGTYSQIKNDLKENYIVVFSGTPCQVAGVRNYVGEEKNLYTIDIVCNGVGSPAALQSYLKQKYGTVNRIDMRHKDFYHGSIFYKWFIVQTKNKTHKERMNHFLSAYYSGQLNRISCFSCPYAKTERCSDFTIGDVHTNYPFLLEEEYKNGVSVLLVNTQHTSNIVELLEKYTVMTSVPYDSIYRNSLRLREAGTMPVDYPKLMHHIITGKKPDSYIKKSIPVVPMWKQKLGEMIPEHIWKKLHDK